MASSRTFEVTQDSMLGRLGLSALVSLGFCGPPCGLSDLKVRVDTTRTGDSSEFLTVNFYDMSGRIDPGKRYYSELKAAIDALAA